MAETHGYEGRMFPGTMDEEEQKETDKLRKALFEDFTMFLLNNILMSVQFFESYEREMTDLRDSCLNESTLDAGNFKIFDADSLHKLISTKVVFQKISTTKKDVPELLHPLRTYVTYQNAEVANNASSLGGKRVNHSPYYRLIAQRCEDDRKEASGYVNVIEPAFTEEKSDGVISGAFIHHPDSTNYYDENQEPKKKPIQSGVVLSKSDTFYVLDPKKRSKPYLLKDYRTNERISQLAAIPKSCFKEYEKQFVGNKNRRIGILLRKDGRGKMMQKILISSAFKRHFSEVFATHLAGQLEMDRIKLETAIFHLDHIAIKKQYAIHHVIPVLEMKEWPHAITNDLSSNKNKENGIQWPTKKMQGIIQKLGCSLLPMGYHETTDENTDYTLEWMIDFPKAEKFLITHMMHTHVRCYIFALILYKTFIGTEVTAPQFGPKHMINLLFLMVRKNFLAWPEYSQGETFMKYLRILEKTLQKKCLKSFFLTNRNLYANSPQRVLHKSQTIIMRILQNPIPHILKAFMNLKFKDDFYPELDYLKLYNILTVKNLSEYLHPTPPKKLKGRKTATGSNPPVQVLGRDTIDEEELVEEKNTPLHREEVLRLFIDHFINVANHSRKYQSYDYSMLYLIHARRLTMILSEESATRGEIQDFNERIENAILHCSKSASKGGDVKTEKKQNMKDITLKRLGTTPRRPVLPFKQNLSENDQIKENDENEGGTRL